MAENSNIEWCDHTFNGWIGCTNVSPACDNCYAENWGKRFGVEWGAGKKRRLTSDANWRKPLVWNSKAGRDGTRLKVFANSLSDVFDIEIRYDWRDRLFSLIEKTPNLDWMILTKRPKVARDYLTNHTTGDLGNLWLGTTVENQAMANLRIPLLLDTPAAKLFLSCEPLLGPINLDVAWPRAVAIPGAGIDLVIAGGESGKGSRPSHPDWFRGLRDQCDAADVPFFFKQWGDWIPDFEEAANRPDDDPEQSRFPTCVWDIDENCWDETNGCWDDNEQWAIADNYQDPEQSMTRVGKKAAGRLLDGREWSELPK